MKLFRWKAVVPLIVFLLLAGVAWYLLVDLVVERSVEKIGARIVGAKVDVERAEVRLWDGVVTLRGLQVTNPDRPMTNLVEADEIVLNLRVAPLLEKKLIIDTVAFRGVRFGTDRTTSGAIERSSAVSGAIRRDVMAWRDRLRLPTLSFDGLGEIVDVAAIDAESLRTLREADAVRRLADSARARWVSQLRAIDPRAAVDSARALVDRLARASIRSLGLVGARNAVGSARGLVRALERTDEKLSALQAEVRGGLAAARQVVARMEAARTEDYAYARGLLRLPSIDAPALAPALFGELALERVVPFLTWLRLAERYLPPGIESRLRQGPERTRMSGTTVAFPRRERLPGFLLEFAEADVTIGDSGAGAGNYVLRITDLASAPALIGRPTTFMFGRADGSVGARTIRVGGTFDHVGRPIRDSLAVLVDGVRLPTVDLTAIGARLLLGEGTTELTLVRQGDSLDARWSWRAARAQWERLGESQSRTSGRVADVLWRLVSGLQDVTIEAHLSGPIAAPRLGVGSNVARVLATGLRARLGQEIRRAERQVRARVDALVEDRVGMARGAVASLEREVADRLAAQRQEIGRVRSDLERRIRSFGRGMDRME